MGEMVMEAHQDREIVVVVDSGGCSNSKEVSATTNMIVKGKRTKRQRQPSPLPFPPPPMTTTNSNASNCNHVSSTATSSATTTQSSAESTCTEEEDMANCLILLAQGRRSVSPPPPEAVMKASEKPPHPAAATAVDQRGVFVYQCKTCDRCFNSFQALGGHRASHKKPRIAGGDGEGGEENNNNNNQINRKVVIKPVNQKLREEGGEELSLSLRIVTTAAVNDNRNPLALAAAAVAVTKPTKVHECSICGAGFSSGQALGGHMRRHRTVVPTPPPTTMTAVRNGLELDLNLPAPEDEPNKFRFGAKALQLVFSAASPMVDCHF